MTLSRDSTRVPPRLWLLYSEKIAGGPGLGMHGATSAGGDASHTSEMTWECPLAEPGTERGGGGSVLKSKRFTARFLAVNRLTTVNRLRYRLTARSKEVHLLSNTVNRLKKQFSSSCTQIAVHWLIYRAEPFVRLKRDVSRLTALFYLGLPTYVRGQLPRYKIAKIFRLWRRSQLIKTVNWQCQLVKLERPSVSSPWSCRTHGTRSLPCNVLRHDALGR